MLQQANNVNDLRHILTGPRKDFWCLKTKNELSDNCFWDDWMMNAVKVYSEKTISKKEVEQLNNIGVW